MKKSKMAFTIFIIGILFVIGFFIYYIFNNISYETYEFSNDGYALYANNDSEFKTESYSFNKGTKYNYLKLKNKINFESNDGNVNIDESTVIHYTDNSIFVLKNVVGLDLTTIDKDIIFYYNIYKNTQINYNKDNYSVLANNNEKITFKNLLIRINDNKFLLLSDNIRVTMANDEVIDFGKYVYFEYEDGSIIKIYNNTKSFKSIASNINVVCGENTINLGTKTISKSDKKYITLTNLVIDNDANIDLIVNETQKLPEINQSNSNTSGSVNGNMGNNSENNQGNNIIDGSGESDIPSHEEIVDDSKNIKQPIFKVTEMILTPIKIDAKVEIEDSDNVIVSPTEVSIVENSTSKVLYTNNGEIGDTSVFVSYAALKPDVEYTLNAKASYEIDGVEYSKTFISKIFRTEALGVSFEKAYATDNSMAIKLTRENYSEVSSVTVSIYDSNNDRIGYETVDFSAGEITEVLFEGLESNQIYKVVMHDILCQGVVVQDGYSEKAYYQTLKKAPSIGELQYSVDKKNNSFSLSPKNIIDTDYGIINYRYEIYDARQDLNNEKPILILNKSDMTNVIANVDENKLYRGVAYTYKLVIEFNDNEKIVEYSKELGKTMQLDGVEYPTIKFDENKVTWEQINGVIVVDDPSGAVVSENFKVVYHNSLGIYTSKEIIADSKTGSIGINVNNLRANETYTFQVFADLNMQDGNPVVKDAYIGSVFVQTKKPNTLYASYNPTSSYSTAFNVNFMLSNPKGKDSSLEASTLSEITLSLYQGTNTNGTKEVFRRVVDLNNDDYKSTIKEEFYDEPSVINPAFFDTKNTDYTEKVYTLKVSGAYDYTDYKNEIKIENDEFTININSYIPDIPDDPNKAILPIKILNQSAESFGMKVNPNLDPKTIVGYNLVANYLNEAKNAVRMVYHVYMYDHQNNKYIKLENLDRSVNYDKDGNVEPVVYELYNGTKDSIVDTDKLRRGNEYYFTYEVMLDVDQNGVEDSVYPNIIDKSTVLRCEALKPEKQSSKFYIYPSISSNETATWKYKYVDYDNALYDNNLYSYIGNSVYYSSNPKIKLDENYQSIIFEKLSKNNFYSIKKHEKKLKSGKDKYDILTSQYFYGLNSSLDLTYSTKIDDNALIISLDNYYEKTDLVDKIVSADVKIIPTNSTDLQNLGTLNLTNLTFDAGNININLYDIAKYLNKEIKIELIVYIDSGNTGFDVPSSYKALQNAGIDENANYYYLNNKNILAQNSIIEGSEFSTKFDLTNKILKIINKTNKSLNLDIDIDESGIYELTTANNILLKELKSQSLSSENNVNKFDLIVPSISMLNSTGNKININPLLNTAKINPKISVAESTKIENNMIYIDLYKTNDDGVNAEFIKTISKTLDELKNEFTITGLNPKTSYYIQFHTKVLDKGNYVDYYLYDIDFKRSAYTYEFKTLSDVGINNIRTSFETKSYQDKKVRFDYTIESIHGYDYIRYKLYEKVGNEYKLLDIDIPNSEAFFTNMSFSLDASPGNAAKFSYGKKYKIEISPIGHYENNGQKIEIDLGSKSQEFTLKDFEKPYIGISTGKTIDSIYFKVSIDDETKVLQNDKYSVKLLNSNYDLIKAYDDIDANIINKTFTFKKADNNLIDGEVYMLVVMLKADYKNSNNNFTELKQSKSIRFGDSVSLGSVTANKNPNDNYAIDIIFADSYKLDSIDTISYTVSSTSVSYFSTGSGEFNKRYDTNSNMYIYTMKVLEDPNFKSGIMYTITMNFYSKNELVSQEEISYYNGGTP